MAERDPEHEIGTIVVSGTGRVEVEPDVADLRLGVAVSRPTVETARAEAARIMEAILASVEAAGSPGGMSAHRCYRSSRATITAMAGRRR